ncbi:MAG: T9SS type A sorting domain-containing protein [Ignavibacteria bacterium]|nr:T9SS type A sorting domain-containing protein [Ignavibacteria bacterium]
MRRFFLILVFLELVGQAGIVQAQSITWEKRYDNPGTIWDGINSICESDSGNFFLVGYTLIPTPTNHYKIWVIKIDSYGDTLWKKAIGRDGSIGYSIVSSGDGGCVITGRSNEAFTIKIDRNGNIVWEKYYGVTNIHSNKIIETSDRGYIVCGKYDLQNGFILKIDSIGNYEWSKILNSNYQKEFFDISENFNKEYTACGYIKSNSQDTSKGVLTKIDRNGKIIWEQNYIIQNIGTIFLKLQETNENYFIAGEIGNTVTAIKECFIVKINKFGKLREYNILNTNRNEYLGDFKFINENKFVLSIARDSGIIALKGKALIIDSSAKIIHQKIFPTTDFIEFRSILPLTNGDIIFSGIAGFNIPGADDIGYAIRTDSTLNFKPINVSNNTLSIPEDYILYQNYPNPFNPNTTIIYELKKKTEYVINLYDISGKIITTLTSGVKTPGNYEVKLNTKELGLSSGVYFVNFITSTGETKIIKITLLK